MKKLRRGSSNLYAAIKKLVWESEFKQWHEYAQLELELQNHYPIRKILKVFKYILKEDKLKFVGIKILALFFEA